MNPPLLPGVCRMQMGVFFSMRTRTRLALVSLALWGTSSSLPAVSAAAVRFTGNRSIPAEVLEKHLRTKQVLVEELAEADPGTLDRTARLVRFLYQERGYPLARAGWSVDAGGVEIGINEGPRAGLGMVVFEGNQNFSAERLLETLDLDQLDFNRLEAGLERLRALYRDSGFLQVTIGEPRVEVVERTERDDFPIPFRSAMRQRVRLTVPVAEGEVFHFGTVERHPECSELEYPEEGQLYQASRLARLRERLLRCFFERGQMVRDLQVTESLRPGPPVVDVQVAARLLPPLEIARIEFEGNHRFPDGFYRRELELEEQQLLDPRKLETSLGRLLATGVLTRLDRDDVELSVRDPLLVDITIRLHERQPRKIEFSLSPDGLGGLEMGLLYTVFNALGLGERLGLEMKVGSHTSEVAVSAASRYFLGTQIPAALALRFFRRNTAFRLPGVEEPLARLIERDSWGFEGGGSYRITQPQSVRLAYSFEQLRRPQRSRHFVLHPSWEYRASGAAQSTSLALGERFSLLDAEERFGSLRSDLILARRRPPGRLDLRTADFRFHFSYAHFFGRAEPLFERLHRDEDELRTFALTAGPWAEVPGEGIQPVGGDLLWSFSSDYQLPLRRNVSLVPFFDIGMNRASSGLQPGAIVGTTNGVLRAALGAELRFRPSPRLPTARLIAAWRPLRLDALLLTASGKARLRESPFALKIAF